MMKKNLWWFLPVLAMIAVTPFVSSWDLAIARFYYRDHFAGTAFYDFMFDYGPWPALALSVAAAIVLVLSYCFKAWRRWREPAWVLVLTSAIGAGLIVHVILKDHWGRPRPKQVIEFGGQQVFRPYYSPNFFHQPESSRGFPCGHCTMGFYFFAAALVCQRLSWRTLSYLSYALAIALGIALSFTRMAQGGHFLSDALITALIMWLSAGFFDWLVFRKGTAE